MATTERGGNSHRPCRVSVPPVDRSCRTRSIGWRDRQLDGSDQGNVVDRMSLPLPKMVVRIDSTASGSAWNISWRRFIVKPDY